ncbi:MAG TPA: (4Fe-4S)-binding protein, partial [Roseiarcus sp.]|nr:(4Fe-4S)-binding protein [Roseiarcus sp.]
MAESSIEVVAGEKATIRFNAALCIHSRGCVLSQPHVFKANVEGSWIDPDAADPDALLRVAINCPSGAIQVERRDGGPGERPPEVNTIGLRENGPLAVHATIEINGKPVGTRATLCRCGASKNKPFCDGSHVAAAFVATG